MPLRLYPTTRIAAMGRLRWWFVAFGLLHPAWLFAQQVGEPTLATDRPSFAAGPGTVPVGHGVIEAGVQYQAAGDDDQLRGPFMLARVGVGSNWELRFGLPDTIWTSSPARGGRLSGGPAGLGFKYGRSFDEGISLALLPAMTLPMTRGQLEDQGFLGVSMDLPIAVSITDRVGVAAMVGAAVDRLASGEQAAGQARFSVSTSVAFTDWLAGYIEFYTTVPLTENPGFSPYGDMGLLFQPTRRFQIDLYGGSALFRERDAYLGLGLGALY